MAAKIVKGQRLAATLVCALVLGVCVWNAPAFYENFKILLSRFASDQVDDKVAIKYYDRSFSNTLARQDPWLDLNGLFNRALGKREVNGFSVLKDNQGMLYSQFDQARSPEELARLLRQAQALTDTGKGLGAVTVFYQYPEKSPELVPELSGYAQSYRAANADSRMQALGQAGFQTLDLRPYFREMPGVFYKTDHHWTGRAGFLAAQHVMADLIDTRGFAFLDDPLLRSAENYRVISYPRSFLGSFGIKTGSTYTGRDDFDVLLPTFPTQLHFTGTNSSNQPNADLTGPFEDTLINWSLLDDTGYKNKYNTFLYTQNVECIVVNAQKETGRLLFISNSFGRAMFPYLSLFFKESRMLDPQDNRFEGNILKYIEDYRPDVIMMAYDGPLNMSGTPKK